MPFRLGPFFLHSSAMGVMTYGYLNLHNMVQNQWISKQTCGHFQFLTIQGLTVAWIVMAVSVLTDLFPSNVLKTTKRSLLMIALPVACVVSTIYWSLVTFAPKLILQRDPSVLPSSSHELPSLIRIPLPMDLALHASPALSLVADFFLFERKFTVEAWRAPYLVAVAGLWYISCVEYCSSYNGRFPYPFLNNPFLTRVLIYLGACSLALVSFYGINRLHPKA